MSGQQHTPAALYPGKDPVPILQETGWAPGSVWTGGKSRPHRDSTPDRPSRNSVAIPTELPGPCFMHITYLFMSRRDNISLTTMISRNIYVVHSSTFSRSHAAYCRVYESSAVRMILTLSAFACYRNRRVKADSNLQIHVKFQAIGSILDSKEQHRRHAPAAPIKYSLGSHTLLYRS